MEKELRILILEDLPSDAELAQKELKKFLKNFSTKVVETEKDFVQALEEFKPDLIISDYHLPAFDGLAALRITREKSPLIPFIIFTGSINEETAVECIQAGADDYVIKESIKRLAPAVLGAMEKKKTEQERLNAIQALRESEENYRGLFENALVGVVISNSAGKVITANKTMSKMTGYSLEEFSEVNIGDTYLNPESRKRFLEIMNRDGLVENFDVQLINKEGDPYWASLSSRPIKFDGEDAFLTTALDITERVLGTENLKKEKEFSEKIINTSNALIIGLDKNHLIKLFNSGAENNTGYKSTDVLEKDWFEIFFPDEIMDEMELIWEGAWGEKAHSNINPIKIKNGTERIISWQTTGMYEDDDVKNQLMISIGEDITERKQAEEKLLLNQYYLTKAQEMGIIGTWELDIKKDILRWTDENYHIFGVPPGTEMNLERFLNCIHPDDRDYVAEKWNVGLNNEPYDIEHRIIVNDKVKWVREKAEVEFDPEGNPIMAIGFTQDITERKLVEQEKELLLEQVQQANERLKALSREIINAQEAERKRISRELHDELGQALTAISLDLKIIERALNPETDQVIAQRISETIVIADEIDQRISELALDLRPSLLDDLGLIPTLNWYVARYSKRAEVEVEIKFEIDDQEKRLSPEIETALYRIIQEALTNVARHAQAKNVQLRLEQRPTMVEVIIEDDGRGFDLEELQSTGSSPQGLGLIGMKDRISILGGRLDIQSKPGEGTRIEIEVPL